MTHYERVVRHMYDAQLVIHHRSYVANVQAVHRRGMRDAHLEARAYILWKEIERRSFTR